MIQKRLTTIALGVTAALSLSACDFTTFDSPSTSQLAAPAVQIPQAPAAQTRIAQPSPRVTLPSAASAPARAATRPQTTSAPRVQPAAVPAPTRVAAQSTAAPTVTTVKPATAKPTVESCKVKKVAGCAFVAQQGFGDGGDSASGGGGWDG